MLVKGLSNVVYGAGTICLASPQQHKQESWNVTGNKTASAYRRRSLVVLATFTLGSTAEARAPANGRVRVMHASPDAPSVDIFVDNTKAVSGVAFPDDTGYVSLAAGSHDVKVFVSPFTTQIAPALSATFPGAAGQDYTVLAVGRVADGSLALLPLTDNNASPAEGAAHISVIHASPDVPSVHVALARTKTNIFSDVVFQGVGDNTPVASGTYGLDVNLASTGRTVKAVNDTGVSGSSSSNSIASLVLSASLGLILAGGAGLTFALRRSR